MEKEEEEEGRGKVVKANAMKVVLTRNK